MVSLSTSSFFLVLLFPMSRIPALLADSFLHPDPNETLTLLGQESLQLQVSIIIFNVEDKLPEINSIETMFASTRGKYTSFRALELYFELKLG
ncbi:hypothetical protein V2J09_003417 [Rumex salicifolius]